MRTENGIKDRIVFVKMDYPTTSLSDGRSKVWPVTSTLASLYRTPDPPRTSKPYISSRSRPSLKRVTCQATPSGGTRSRLHQQYLAMWDHFSSGDPQEEEEEEKKQNNFLPAIVVAAGLLLLSPSFSSLASPVEYYHGKEIFKASQYAGRWYEIASLKEGFAGEGQADCHCTQGLYTPVQIPGQIIALQVNTFCVHGSPEGNLSGIQGLVTCADPYDLAVLPEFESEFERQENILEKCSLQFPSIPIIPSEPYDVIRTDYISYALVQGAADRSFVQIYSRKPHPGPEFLKKRLNELKELGYPVERIKETPQDCDEMEPSMMMKMMNDGMKNGAMRSMMANRGKASSLKGAIMRGMDLGPVERVQFEGSRNLFQTLSDLVTLKK